MKNIMKIIEKGVISVQELRELSSSDDIREMQSVKPDAKHPGLLKYNVYLENGELHFIYVK